jgi:predicted alpha/beta-fold hydrolase
MSVARRTMIIDKGADRHLCEHRAQMAELVDALVSGTSGESRGGSSPLLGTIFLGATSLATRSRRLEFASPVSLDSVAPAGAEQAGRREKQSSRALGRRDCCDKSESAAVRDKVDTPTEAFPPFRERAPWFGGDLQTLRNVLRPLQPDLSGGARLLLPLPDGEKLAARLDRPIDWGARPLVVLVHGLAGCETSRNVVATARALVARGWPVLRLNLRGSEPSLPTAPGHYHAGRTEDLAGALRALPPELTRSGIVLVGHSLGGNLVLKFMGEGGHGLPVLAAVAVSAPLDLAATCARMMAPRNFAYHATMLDAMKREALAPGAALSGAERAAVAAARTVYEFDDCFIAPRFGYRDALDYYEHNSAEHFLAGIGQPTLILHALDDPWIPATCYTRIDWPRLPAIEPILTPRGGHLGFHGSGSLVPWHDRMTDLWLALKLRLEPSVSSQSASSPR